MEKVTLLSRARRDGNAGYRVLPTVAATHAKLAASLEQPLPFQRAICPNGHSGRVLSTTPLVTWAASIRAGAEPVLIHSSSAPTLSKTSVPGPPWQWFIPGTMYN